MVMEFTSGAGEIFPGVKFFSARGAVAAMIFQCGPFLWRAIKKNSFAIVACDVHGDYLASAALLRGASSIWRSDFFA